MRYFLLTLIFYLLMGCQAIHQNALNKKALKVPKSTSTIALREVLGKPIYIRIFKEEKILELWVQQGERYTLFKTYPIQKTSGLLGPKQREGDRQNPEGVYVITKKNLNPFSHYYLSMNIGYPNRLDRNLKRTGSAIMIHGGCKSIGCFALGDKGIKEIYTLAANALAATQKFFYVAIYPFKMQEEKLKQYQNVKWFPFWQNLKEGYDLFNQEHYPPKVTVKGDKYCFKSALKSYKLTSR